MYDAGLRREEFPLIDLLMGHSMDFLLLDTFSIRAPFDVDAAPNPLHSHLTLAFIHSFLCITSTLYIPNVCNVHPIYDCLYSGK